MILQDYYNKIYTLSKIIRYSNVNRIQNEDVAQHSFFVAAIILKLHDQYSFNLGRALQIAISHDIPEADISDITHQIKQTYPELQKVMSTIERKVIKKYPLAVKVGFDLFESGSCTEGLIANYADVLQVCQYASSEISIGNVSMKPILQNAKKRSKVLQQKLIPHLRTENTA